MSACGPCRWPSPRQAELALGSFPDRRDWMLFSEAYADPNSGASLPDTGESRSARSAAGRSRTRARTRCSGDIANLKAALDAAGIAEGFMNSVAPASCARFGNEYYETDEELLYACADAMREEYKAIVDAGLILQLDDPAIAENWDQISPTSRRSRPTGASR